MKKLSVLIATCLALNFAASAQDQLIVPPPGDYRVVDLVLEKAGQKNADLLLRGAARNGKIPVPSALSMRDIIGALTVEPSAIRGEYFLPGVAHAGAGMGAAAGKFQIDAKVAEGQVTGSWKLGDKTGLVRGTVKTEAQLRQENAFVTKADWPQWNGPFTSMAATPTGVKLVDDFAKDARLVWRSEELVPRGPGNSLNYPGLALVMDSNGGGSSLVVADGKVFVNYYQPSGDEVSKGLVYFKDDPEYKPAPPDEFLAYMAKKKGITISPFMREKWAVKADDVVVCIDAATGKTLWKNVFVGKSMNQPSHKGGAVNNTPCVGGGKVFAMGPGGRAYGIEIATGKVLWERPGMSAEGVQPWSGARNMCTAPIYAGGVLILPDHGSSLTGLDPETGKDLWKLPGKSYRFQVPAKWTHQGQEYVLSMTSGTSSKEKGLIATAACIEPKTGKILWEVELPANPTKGVIVYGDLMYVIARPPSGAVTTAYRLGLDKATQVWQTPTPDGNEHTVAAATDKLVVVKGGATETYLLDAATGKLLATYSGNTGANEVYAAIMEDKVLLSLDGSHGSSAMMVLGTTPETFSKGFGNWGQPHPQTTSYHGKYMTFPMVEGRIFFRGVGGVYCYDLRAAKP